MAYRDLTPNQTRVQIDARQAYEAFLDAKRVLAGYTGGMKWKKVGGREYLIKVVNRTGSERSLGPRTPAMESLFDEWKAGKARAQERSDALAATVREFAGMSVGVGINRVPSVVTSALRRLDEHGLLGKNIMVIGTNAMYAYEAAASVMFDAGLMATTDVDFLWDSRSTLKLALLDNQVAESGLLAILRKVDRSFEPLRNSAFRAANKAGFTVDLIKQTPNPPWKKGERERIAAADLTPTWIPSMKWLLSSEKFTSIVIGQDGAPAPIVAPDPRAFATFKMWLSQQDDREPAKKKRDRLQAIATSQLIEDRFPHLPFDENCLRMFPESIRESAPNRQQYEL